jgi:CubicO group peptidase (beta-lactamase class C family)
MKKYLLFIPFIVSLLSCKEAAHKTSSSPPFLYDSSYVPAGFADTGNSDHREQKIRSACAVIDSIYKKYAEENHFPAIAFGIVANGQLVYKNSYGYTDIAKKIPATPASLFRIASMSKSFTCMAILKLRDEGKLNLDDPAYLYIPELKNLKYPAADAPVITIRHLMTHSAGFPEDNPWGDRQLADNDEDLMRFIGRQISFSNAPGIAFEYSNLGFALQGKIITKVSGIRYQDYIKKNILDPLGMKNTTYEYGDVDPGKLAHGYRWLNNKWNEEALLHDTKDGSWGAMGAMISSIDEFAAYMAFHLGAWPPSNAKETGPVKRSSVREMHQPWRWDGMVPDYTFPDGRTCAIANAYGYGVRWMSDCNGRTYIFHSGGLPGFGSQWRIMPDYGIGVVAFGNRTYAPMGPVNLRVLDTLIKIAGLQPRQPATSKILEQRKAALLKLLPDWNNAQQGGIFAENFFADYPVDSLRKQARDLYSKAGKIIAVKEMKPGNQLRGSFILEGERTNIEIYFTLSPENPPLIQEYKMRELIKGGK